MKIYNNTLLENTLLKEEAARLKAAGFINAGQYTAIKENLPGLKTQNSLLIRLGLFLLGGILFISLCGVCSLSLLNNYSEGFLKFLVLLFAVIGFAGAEFLIRSRNYCGYGLEEAFILGGQVTFVIFIHMLSLNNNDYGENDMSLSVPLATAFIGMVATLRYINLLSVIVAFTGASWSLIQFFTDTVYLGYFFLPCILMLFSALFYYLSDRIYNQLQQPFYSQSLALVNSLCLILFYFSGNRYFAFEWLRPASDGYTQTLAGTPNPVVFLFFWIFTFAVPPAYIYFSLKKRSRVMFWTGCMTLACSFITFRVYYQVLPIEYALTAGGILLFIIAMLAIRKLKNKEEGITFRADRFEDKNGLMNAEALMVTAQLGMKPADDSESKPFSGGEGFNGGGSGGTF